MLQPYLDGVDDFGETALLHFGGSYSHAIRKGPLLRAGDALVEGLFAPEQITPRAPDDAEQAPCGRRTAALPFAMPLYARVDLIRDLDGQAGGARAGNDRTVGFLPTRPARRTDSRRRILERAIAARTSRRGTAGTRPRISTGRRVFDSCEGSYSPEDRGCAEGKFQVLRQLVLTEQVGPEHVVACVDVQGQPFVHDQPQPRAERDREVIITREPGGADSERRVERGRHRPLVAEEHLAREHIPAGGDVVVRELPLLAGEQPRAAQVLEAGLAGISGADDGLGEYVFGEVVGESRAVDETRAEILDADGAEEQPRSRNFRSGP